MKPHISIVIPSIRVNDLPEIYNSVNINCPWEFIIVSPYDLPDFFKDKTNIKYVKDFGSPTRASCIGHSVATGDLIFESADDGIVISETLQKSIDIMDENKDNEKFVVVNKYLEGSDIIQPDDYYKICNAYVNSPYINLEWLIFNTVIIRKSYYDYLGGLDCIFKISCLAHADLAIRSQMDGCIVHFSRDPILKCRHGQNDHEIISHFHLNESQPLLRYIYSQPDCVNRIRIDLDNWKNSPEVWERFK